MLCALLLMILLAVGFFTISASAVDIRRSHRTLASLNAVRRGGTFHWKEDRYDTSLFERNPYYVPSIPRSSSPPRLGDLDHTTTSSFATYENDPKLSMTTSFSPSIRRGLSQSSNLLRTAVQYIIDLHQLSPILMVSLLTCIGVFVAWAVPICQPALNQYFVCSRRNLHQGRYMSLICSAFSHSSVLHLAFNMMAFLSLGPIVRRTFLANGNWPLWPLIICSSLSGSAFFLLLDRQHGGCMGLSAVVLALLAVYGRLFPNNIIGIFVGPFPVRLPAGKLVFFMLIYSLLSSFTIARSATNVAHSAHLGGLLCGELYYELWRQRRRIKSFMR